jgi:hypothetical protein
MLTWFYRWRFNRSRQLFKYWNGQQHVKADPIVIYRDLQTNENWDQDKDIQGHLKGRDESTIKCVKVSREVFHLKTWDGTEGLSEDESLSILAQFMNYTDYLKKSTSGSQISPESTEQPPESSEPSTTTKWPADSTSMDIGKSLDEPESWSQEHKAQSHPTYPSI